MATVTRIQLTPPQINTLNELLASGFAETLNIGPANRGTWKFKKEKKVQPGEIEVVSSTGIPVVIRNDGEVAEIDLGSYLQGSPPDGNCTPENRLRVAKLVLRYSGSNFSEVCEEAGGTKEKFNGGWNP